MLLDRLMSNLEVRVEYFALCALNAGWRICLPGSPEVTVHFVLKGRGVIRGPSALPSRIGPGWAAVVPKLAMHSLEAEGSIEHELRIEGPPEGDGVAHLAAGPEETAGLRIACGSVQVRYGESIGLFDHLRDILVMNVTSSARARHAFESVLEELSHPGPGSEAMTSALMTESLIHILRALCEGADCPLPWLEALEDPRLSRALDLILRDPGAHLTVDLLAEAADMSRSAFAKAFAEAFSMPPMGLVHYIRMQRASRLIRQGGQSIDEVAARVGFSSRSHFSRCFKEHTGLTPAHFRDRRP